MHRHFEGELSVECSQFALCCLCRPNQKGGRKLSSSTSGVRGRRRPRKKVYWNINPGFSIKLTINTWYCITIGIFSCLKAVSDFWLTCRLNGENFISVACGVYERQTTSLLVSLSRIRSKSNNIFYTFTVQKLLNFFVWQKFPPAVLIRF